MTDKEKVDNLKKMIEQMDLLAEEIVESSYPPHFFGGLFKLAAEAIVELTAMPELPAIPTIKDPDFNIKE